MLYLIILCVSLSPSFKSSTIYSIDPGRVICDLGVCIALDKDLFWLSKFVHTNRYGFFPSSWTYFHHTVWTIFYLPPKHFVTFSMFLLSTQYFLLTIFWVLVIQITIKCLFPLSIKRQVVSLTIKLIEVRPEDSRQESHQSMVLAKCWVDA